ncbi:MAG: 3D domain-containing protein, partial [Verrucomicrobiota bacterium]
SKFCGYTASMKILVIPALCGLLLCSTSCSPSSGLANSLTSSLSKKGEAQWKSTTTAPASKKVSLKNTQTYSLATQASKAEPNRLRITKETFSLPEKPFAKLTEKMALKTDSPPTNSPEPVAKEKKNWALGSKKDPPLHRQTIRTTAYSHLEMEPGAPWMKNAIGTNLRYGEITSAAADWSRFPLGTQFRIIGIDRLYEIDDFGSALVGKDVLDLYCPTLEQMNDWGMRNVEVEIVKWGCYHRSATYLKRGLGHWHVRQMYECIQPKLTE